MGIENNIKDIRFSVSVLKTEIMTMNEKLDRLLKEKAPNDRSEVKKETEDALSLSDNKPVDMNIKEKQGVQDVKEDN